MSHATRILTVEERFVVGGMVEMFEHLLTYCELVGDEKRRDFYLRSHKIFCDIRSKNYVTPEDEEKLNRIDGTYPSISFDIPISTPDSSASR